MRSQTVEELRAGDYTGMQRLRLQHCGLTSFPREVLDLAPTLEILDLSSNPISALPKDFHRLANLKILFLSDCQFTTFPKQLAQCPNLEMVAFRGNGLTSIPEDSLPPKLRWLILTNNRIAELPRSIGHCYRLQKVMLAGNKLTTLPAEMAKCKKLGLLRISANRIETLPEWLFTLPELAFLSFAGNPCAPIYSFNDGVDGNNAVLDEVPWEELAINELLGEGASGLISKGVWRADMDRQGSEVAIKVFKGEVTSDGLPADEMSACIAAGSHPNLIDPIGKIQGHPNGKLGLVLQLISPMYSNLGLPPNLQTCTRDNFVPGTVFSIEKVKAILLSIGSAANHLHSRRIAHGDLYAHNVLVDEAGHALLGDFGAATIYSKVDVSTDAIERLEVLAFGHLIEDMLTMVDREAANDAVLDTLYRLHLWCTGAVVKDRPLFGDILDILGRL